jgi:hypothetical protein
MSALDKEALLRQAAPGVIKRIQASQERAAESQQKREAAVAAGEVGTSLDRCAILGGYQLPEVMIGNRYDFDDESWICPKLRFKLMNHLRGATVRLMSQETMGGKRLEREMCVIQSGLENGVTCKGSTFFKEWNATLNDKDKKNNYTGFIVKTLPKAGGRKRKTRKQSKRSKRTRRSRS